jgi:5'-nucleotidase
MSATAGNPLSLAYDWLANRFGKRVEVEIPADKVQVSTIKDKSKEVIETVRPEIQTAIDNFSLDPNNWKIKINRTGFIFECISEPTFSFGSSGISGAIWYVPGGDNITLNRTESHHIRSCMQVRKSLDGKAKLESTAKHVRDAASRLESKPMPTYKPILLIDMDGVVADYFGAFVQGYRRNHPDRPIFDKEEMSDFYLENVLGNEVADDIFRITRAKDFFRNLKPMPGAVAALTKILAEGRFDPYLCSSPDNDYEDLACHSEKVQWVKEVLGPEWVDRLILAKDKTLVHGDYIIDDKPVMKGRNMHNPSWERIVFHHAYNSKIKGERLHDWRDWPNVQEIILSKRKD